MNLIRKKFRRNVFREFRNWYEENHQRFLMPLKLIKSCDHTVHLSVGTIPETVMTVVLNYNRTRQNSGLDCAAYFGQINQCHDSMCWLDAFSMRQGSEFVCIECAHQGNAVGFPSRKALWIDHIFEPLLAWINDTLAKTREIEFYQYGSCSWVVLNSGEAGSPNAGHADDLIKVHKIDRQFISGRKNEI